MTSRLMDKQVIVVGGGISGMAVAFHLLRKGIAVRLVERNKRPGGLIRSQREAGFLLEHAATCIFNFLPEVDLFCRSLGLDQHMVLRREAAKQRYLLKNGRPTAVPKTLPGFLTSKLISPMGKVRLLLEMFVPRGAEGGDQETVAEFITRRFGREFFEQTIEPYVSGTLAGDAERACLRSVFSQFAALEEEHGSVLKGAIIRKLKGVRTVDCEARVFSFFDGMAALTNAAAQKLATSFLPNRTVQGIEREGKQWSVFTTLADGVTESYAADAVVIATPAFVAGKLMQPLSQDLGMLLAGLTYAPMAISYLGLANKNVEHSLDGIGCLVPKREKDFNILGSLWPASLFAGRAPEGKALFMNYMGGVRRPGMVEKSDAELTDIALTDIRRIVKAHGTPEFAKVIRHKHALPQYNIGHRRFLADVENNLKLLPGLFITGNYLKGVSVRACISNAIETAEHCENLLKNSAKTSIHAVEHTEKIWQSR